MKSSLVLLLVFAVSVYGAKETSEYKELPGHEKDSELTKDQIANFEEDFRVFDMDSDGLLSPKELRTAWSAAHNIGEEDTPAEVQKMIAEIGTIDLPEFLTIMARKITDFEEEITATFGVFDKNRDGFIDVEELGQVLADEGEVLTEEEVEEMMKMADTDEDGKLDEEEYSEFMFSKETVITLLLR